MTLLFVIAADRNRHRFFITAGSVSGRSFFAMFCNFHFFIMTENTLKQSYFSPHRVKGGRGENSEAGAWCGSGKRRLNSDNRIQAERKKIVGTSGDKTSWVAFDPENALATRIFLCRYTGSYQ